MPTYAVLGATGNIGGHVLQTLIKRPDVKIRAFVRSRSKLEKQRPELVNDPDVQARVSLYEGSITSVDVLADCLEDADAAFLCVAAFASTPGCRIALDQATNVVTALEQVRGRSNGNNGAKLPTLIMLSSSETDDNLNDVPWPMNRILYAANYYIYEDLIRAEQYLRQRSDWIDAVYFKPGGISEDVASGHILSTAKSKTWVSFWDVTAGMVQIADDGDRYHGKSVSVHGKRKARAQTENFPMLLKGLLIYLLPFTSRWLV